MSFFCLIIIIISFATNTIALFSNKQQCSSSTNEKTEDIENRMIVDFAKKQDVKYLISYFDANEFQSQKKLYRLFKKVKEESLFFLSKDISNLNSNQEKRSIKINPALHIYAQASLTKFDMLFRDEEQEISASKDRTIFHNHRWLIKIPKNKDKKHVLTVLNDIEIHHGSKIFLYLVREDCSVDIYYLDQTHEDSLKYLKQYCTWSQNKGLSITQEVIKKNQHTLNGKHIRVVSGFNPPAVTYIEDNCSSKNCFKGMFADIWFALVDNLNFTFRIRRANQWGSLVGGKFNGMVGILQEGKADIAVADITVTFARSTVIEYLPTIMETKEGLYMRNPGEAFSLVSYFGPFSKTSWICILLWTIIAPNLLVIMVLLIGNRRGNQNSISSCYFDAITLLLRARNMVIPNHYSIRIAFACVALGGMIFFYHWDAVLIAHMSVKNIYSPLKNLKELSESPQFKFIVSQGTAHLDYFRYSNDPIKSKLWNDKILPYFDDLPRYHEIEKRILNDPYTVAYHESILKMTESYINCEIVEIGEPIRTAHLAFAVQKNSPFYKIFQDEINRLKETGLVQRYIQRYNMESQTCESYSGKSISIQQCGTVFQILFLGAIVSFLGLLAEFCTSHFRKKFGNNLHPDFNTLRPLVNKARKNAINTKTRMKMTFVLKNHKRRKPLHSLLSEDRLKKKLAEQKSIVTRQQQLIENLTC